MIGLEFVFARKVVADWAQPVSEKTKSKGKGNQYGSKCLSQRSIQAKTFVKPRAFQKIGQDKNTTQAKEELHRQSLWYVP